MSMRSISGFSHRFFFTRRNMSSMPPDRNRNYLALPFNTIINFVPQQEAWIVERFGKFHNVLQAGINIVVPIVDQISYVHSLKEVAAQLPSQTAITRDNVALIIDGILYYRVVDPYKASYSIEDHEYAITQLAQTTMRSEIGKMTLDDVFRERDTLNSQIIEAIRASVVSWGLECMRYEIRDVQPPVKIMEAMQLQVEAERKKRAYILESEGARDSAINVSVGESEAIMRKAKAKSQAIRTVAASLSSEGGSSAASLFVAEQYVSAFSNLAKETNTVVLPANLNDMSSSIAQALAIWKNLNNSNRPRSSASVDPLPEGKSNLIQPEEFDFRLLDSPTINSLKNDEK